MSEKPRRPAAFRLNDPRVLMSGENEDKRRLGRDQVRIVQEANEPDLAAPAPQPPPLKRRRSIWGPIFWSALGGLVSLGAGLAVTQLIEDLYARAPWLGQLALILAILAGVALAIFVAREIAGMVRLSALEKLRTRAETVLLEDDRAGAETIVRALLVIASGNPRLANARKVLTGHLDDIIDGGDLIRLTERTLLAPIDEAAKTLVSQAAKRVSVVTAVSPRAAIDLVFVFITAMTLIRRLAQLYGGRPGALGLIRLVRHVVAHLALTGGMAAGDTLVQQMLGHGVAAKLSAKLGEGVLNGLLTARLGLAAIEVIRPLPFSALPRPSIGELAGDLFRRKREAPDNQAES